MVILARSSTLSGVSALPVRVETDVSSGLPSFSIVGLGDASVQESRERVRSAVRNSGYSFPAKRVTVNLSPADVRKTGPAFDLAIAACVVAEETNIPIGPLSEFLLIAELALDGKLRWCRWIIAHAASYAERWGIKMLVAEEDAAEASLVPGIRAYGAKSLREAVEILSGKRGLPVLSRISPTEEGEWSKPAVGGLSEIRGQSFAKRSLEIAAAGRHNLLLEGSPGSGKTMLCRAFESILPPLSEKELLEVAGIRSVAGIRGAAALSKYRPFRTASSSASLAWLLWGGNPAKPGEISLSHLGTLFLDELRDFPKPLLDALRSPLEDGTSVVARNSGTVTFPARFQLIAASNPCPCGFLRDHERRCECDPGAVERYRKKISGPVADRIDLFVPISRPKTEELYGDEGAESSEQVLRRVLLATEKQRLRYGEGRYNATAPEKLVLSGGISSEAEKLLSVAAERMRLTGRGYSKVRRVARTIADLSDSPSIEVEHVTESLAFREK